MTAQECGSVPKPDNGGVGPIRDNGKPDLPFPPVFANRGDAMSFQIIRKITKLTPGMDGIRKKAVPTILLALMIAASPVEAGILGVDVDVGVGIGNGGVDVDADVGVGGVGVGADVGIGGGGVGVGVGVGVAGVPGGPTVPGVPGVVDPITPGIATASGAAGSLVCAKDGNETAYNGFVVRDRDGAMIGWVHEATVSKGGKLLAMRIQSTGSACYKLANAGFRISGGEVWANVDAALFR